MPDTQKTTTRNLSKDILDLIESNKRVVELIPSLQALLAIEKDRGVVERLDQMIEDLGAISQQIAKAASVMGDAIESFQKDAQKRDAREQEIIDLMALVHERLKRSS
ncbi:hypothetical protein DL1_19650 [Thioclava dalianensis]|uniref:Uncharacterized protein n=1 Tax=Thioclava dalianensis TaxID=1185766 RepID=A0A074TEE3_9RHOB|nr:hypothetical protein DL1_19650 [Thioclava dalianensis]SFN53821.1 hypothetical protein SAMN05216224_106241 [Thioclava dalianensis]